MDKRSEWMGRLIAVVALLLVAVLSITVISPKMSAVETHERSIDILDEKKMNAATISTLVSAASVALTFLKDDLATPLAEELADFAGPLLAITCVLQLEKFLLTSFESLSFTILLPLACILGCIYLVFRNNNGCKVWAIRLLCLAMLTAAVIPVSVRLTKNIEDTHAYATQDSFEKVQMMFQTFEHTSVEEDAGWLEKAFKGVVEGVTDTATAAKELLSILIDAVSVLLVTSFVIPILTLLLFVWGIKGILTGQFESMASVTHAIHGLALERKERKKKNRLQSRKEQLKISSED